MARQKRSSGSSGSTFYGILIGLVLGLAAAAAVAYFVMSSPMPFVDKASREPPRVNLDPKTAPDPNRGLAAGVTESKPGQQATAPAPSKDELGALIATLPLDKGTGAPPPLPAPPKQSATTTQQTVSKPAAEDGRAYYLQVGAFRVLEDAEALQARMVLMGLPVQIQRAEVNGALVNRVRVGPYTKLDDMNKVRAQLSQENIQSNVVRQ